MTLMLINILFQHIFKVSYNIQHVGFISNIWRCHCHVCKYFRNGHGKNFKFPFDFLLYSIVDFALFLHFQMFKRINFDLFVVVIGVVVSSANLLVFCYCGALTTNTFLKYTDCLYGSNWYTMPAPLQKYLILMISSAQRRLLYEGHGMTTLNLETFLKAR